VRFALRASLLAAAVGVAACASGSHGAFVWVDDYAPAKAPATGYAIGIGDVVSVSVYGTDNLSTKEAVRPDGKISMPLLGEITAADKAPATLAQELERLLKERQLVVDPRVTVHVDAMKPLSVSVLGKVARPGAFTMEPGSGVAQAIASAGGLTDFADKSQIYLTRSTPPVRLRFTFDQLTGQSGVASQFKVKNGDVIVVY
jgi:polysaccharide export outer membrane protein